MKVNTKKTIQFFLKHAKRYKGLTTAMFTVMVIAVLSMMAVPLFYREFFNILTSGENPDFLMKPLLTIIVYVLIINIINNVFWRIGGYLNNQFQPRVMANILDNCFEYIHKHSFNFFSDNFSGALVKKTLRLISAFENIADKIFWDLTPLFIKILAIFGVLTYLHPVLGGIMASWTVLFVVASYLVANYKVKFDLKKATADTHITANLADTITNNVNIKLFSSLGFECNKFGKATEDWRRKAKKAWDIDNYIELMQGILMTVLEFSIVYIAISLWQKGILTIGDFVLIQAFLIELFMHIWGLGRIIRELYSNFANAEEMIAVLHKPLEITDKKNAKPIKVNHGKVEFKDVCFAYNNNIELIHKLSFKVKASQKVALIGPSGGGKSTITKLLLRLHDIQKGQILVDDQDIAKVTQDSLRAQIALVPQDPILFHRSLMENIRYGRRDAADEEVIAAAKLAHCHTFIKKLPKGYSTFVGERGVKLSGGERQRVAIARAILSNAKILLLDEATSQLDSESEKLIEKALQNLIKNKTTFIIAHRLSTIMQSDKVFVISDGQIVEEGDHTKLVNKKDSLYKRLWDLQIGGYLNE